MTGKVPKLRVAGAAPGWLPKPVALAKLPPDDVESAVFEAADEVVEVVALGLTGFWAPQGWLALFAMLEKASE